jgi:hypothetical protein
MKMIYIVLLISHIYLICQLLEDDIYSSTYQSYLLDMNQDRYICYIIMPKLRILYTLLMLTGQVYMLHNNAKAQNIENRTGIYVTYIPVLLTIIM